jgi:hypothetical protein
MKIVLIVILIDILIFSLASIYATSPVVNHYKIDTDNVDHFGYKWKLENNH